MEVGIITYVTRLGEIGVAQIRMTTEGLQRVSFRGGIIQSREVLYAAMMEACSLSFALCFEKYFSENVYLYRLKQLFN